MAKNKAAASGGEPAVSEARLAPAPDCELTGFKPSLSKRGSAQKEGPKPLDYREKGLWGFGGAPPLRPGPTVHLQSFEPCHLEGSRIFAPVIACML